MCYTQYATKFGKLSSGHRAGKGQFSFQSQRKAMPKNTQTTIQLHSSLMLVMLKILQTRLQQYINCELPVVQAGFRKSREEQEIKLPTSVGSSKKQESSRKIFTSALLTTPKHLCGSQQTVENSERDGNPRPPDMPPEKSVCRSGNNSQNWTWNNSLVPNRERSTSKLYIVTLLI